MILRKHQETVNSDMEEQMEDIAMSGTNENCYSKAKCDM